MQAERRLRDLRGRVKAARAALSMTSRLAEILVTDWRKAAAFYARFGITEEHLRHGVRVTPHDESDNLAEESRYREHGQGEARLWE